MDLDQMAYRCPKAEVVEIVRLEGYRLTFAAAGSGLATIFPEEGSHVDGVLWSLTGDCEKSLDLYEGYPDFYDKQEITVKNKDGREIKAIVYIMTKDYMQNFAYLQTEDSIQEYRIVTVLKADRNLFPFQQKLADAEAVQEYLKAAKQREVFETGDDYLKCIYDKVLTLVTCSYEWSGARNIVLAVPVSGAVWSQKCS